MLVDPAGASERQQIELVAQFFFGGFVFGFPSFHRLRNFREILVIFYRVVRVSSAIGEVQTGAPVTVNNRHCKSNGNDKFSFVLERRIKFCIPSVLNVCPSFWSDFNNDPSFCSCT